MDVEMRPLPGPSAIICMADSSSQLAHIQGTGNVVARLDLIFNDAADAFQIVAPPTIEQARQIFEFARTHIDNNVPFLLLQCEVGVGRSRAATAALVKIFGGDPKPTLSHGTHNRRLYRLILAAAGLAPDPDPLVSIAVRVKYSPERLLMFLLAMRRQRYENWEMIAVTDGPNADAVKVVESLADPRIRIIETAKPLGRWGHPYRQVGIDACRGEFIGLQNDDNYLVPGYLEQMIGAMTMENADLALCRFLHSYCGWDDIDNPRDLGAWMARATIVRKTPWSGAELLSDQDYLKALKAAAGDRIVEVKRVLFVHN
jgi:hypothetical protein